MTQTGRDYHLGRAEREEMLAARAEDVSSARAHRQLAGLHRARATQQVQGEQTAA